MRDFRGLRSTGLRIRGHDQKRFLRKSRFLGEIIGRIRMISFLESSKSKEWYILERICLEEIGFLSLTESRRARERRDW